MLRYAACLFVLLMIPLETKSQTIVVPDEGSTMLLGRGYNSVTNRVGDQCIKRSDVDVSQLGGAGGILTVRYEEIESREDLQRTLAIGGGGGFGYGDFSGSIKADLYNNFEINKHTYYLAVRVEVRKQSEVLEEYSLTEGAKALLNSDIDAFSRVCGDSFIAGRITGGEFIAIVKLQTKNTNELTSLKRKYRSSFEIVNVNTEQEAYIKKTFEEHSGSIRIIRRGGVSEIPDFADPIELKNYVGSFVGEIIGENSHPVAFSIQLHRFENTIEVAGKPLLDLTGSREVVKRLSDAYKNGLDLFDNLTYVIDNTGEFEIEDLSELLAARDETSLRLNNIRAAAKSCEESPFDPAVCKLPNNTEIGFPTIDLPTRISGQYALKQSAACGIDAYEEKQVHNQCRHSSHGLEVVETRNFEHRLTGLVYVPNPQNANNRIHPYPLSGADTQHLRISFGKCVGRGDSVLNDHPEEVPYFSALKAYCPKVAPFLGNLTSFDDSWSFGNATYEGCKGGNGGNGYVLCRVVIERKQPILASSSACGSTPVPDVDRPIYKSCRHPSHGLE